MSGMISCVLLFFGLSPMLTLYCFVVFFYKMAKHFELKFNQVKMVKTDSFSPPLGAAVCILFEFENVLMIFYSVYQKSF